MSIICQQDKKIVISRKGNTLKKITVFSESGSVMIDNLLSVYSKVMDQFVQFKSPSLALFVRLGCWDIFSVRFVCLFVLVTIVLLHFQIMYQQG